MGESEQELVVLVADDDEGMRTFVARALSKAGYEVLRAERGDDAAELLERQPVDLLVSDVRMPGLDGLQLFEAFRRRSPEGRAVLMTGYGTIPQAVLATRKGVEAYLTKPLEKDELLFAVERAAERVRLDREMVLLRRLLRERAGYGGLIGNAPAMLQLYRKIERAARQDASVLICGPSGSGKELVARAVHERGSRAGGPFVAVACGALSPSLAAAELFGAEAGAYTGLASARRGALERADGGTLLLDGVEELPEAVQAPLARALERKEVERLGGNGPSAVSIRVLAATSLPRRELARRTGFRRELLMALDVIPLDVPPLEKRREDIPLLFQAFLEEQGRSDLKLAPEARLILEGARFHGQVRELHNLAERLAHAVAPDRTEIAPEDLPEEVTQGAGEGEAPLVPYRLAMEAFEREWLEDLLARCEGNVAEAARRGGISRPSLHARIQALGIDVEALRRRASGSA